MNKIKYFWLLSFVSILFVGCTNNALVDTNDNMVDNNWTYAKSTKANVEIKDPNQAYNIYFKLRHTADYRYANLFVLVKLKGAGLNKTNRYQFKLAKNDGEWLGKGSGDIFTSKFSLLTNYRFPAAGKFDIEVEQNMRDNPLTGVSDVGITVVPVTTN